MPQVESVYNLVLNVKQWTYLLLINSHYITQFVLTLIH